MRLNSGDVLLLWYMPYPIASNLIAMVSNGEHCDHCAIVLGNYVYEAQPPKVRRLLIPDYIRQMNDWAKSELKWRKKNKYEFICEKWTPNQIINLYEMEKLGKSLLGIKYGMVLNWTFKGPKIHCSEFIGKLLEKGEYMKWEKEYSRIKPVDIRNNLYLGGWVGESLVIPYE